MVSAYGFFQSPKRKTNCLRRGIHDVLDYHGTVILDSGGYQNVRGKRMLYGARELAVFARSCGADYVISLDFPPQALMTSYTRLARKNARNFFEMEGLCENLIPAIHAPIELALTELSYIRDRKPDYVAIGGLVPSLRGGMAMSLNTIERLAGTLSNTRLHLLGFGAPNIGRNIRKLAYSADFAGWRNAAAVGYLLLPSGYRKISRRNKRGHACPPNKVETELMRKLCGRLGLAVSDLERSFQARAWFNAYVAIKIAHCP